MSQAETKKDRVTLMSQSRKLFAAQLKRWQEGKYKDEKRPYGAFRKKLITQFKEKLEVSTASAATMFNNLRKEALAADSELVLARDPKIARVKSGRKPGRPAKAENQTEAETSTENEAETA
tara:strand:- start:2691 stop:3053 length:363 start_codon:yes stop_codon:yes gene_type:complete